MGRAAHCREAAAQLSLRTDVESLRKSADAYEAEADAIDAASPAAPVVVGEPGRRS
jgi:hypothetical protein